MDQMELAEAVRQACLGAAQAAYEDAGLQGLCAEGRWEAAVSAIRRLELQSIVSAVSRDSERSGTSGRDSSTLRGRNR